jgi:hypothetical protein
MLPESCSTVTPFIVDPIKRGRNIGNCFRMNEVGNQMTLLEV